MATQKRLEIRRPDDWHLHLRDGPMMEGVIGESARHVGRAIIMPNLIPPVVTAEDAAAYKERILKALPGDAKFQPLMTLYLTDVTDPNDVASAARSGLITAVKLYPAGATTNSQSGVTEIANVMPVLERMAEVGLVLCVHGEVSSFDVDIFDREARFIETVLDPLRAKLPELRVVLEHITTRDGVNYVKAGGGNIAGTITVHHLMINRNHILAGGIKPHYYCLPVAKREEHRLAVREAATSGDSSFFLGTDSAPHANEAKESACGCAGIFTATNMMNCLAHVFEEDGALDKLEAFTSLNGPAFYGLPPNEDAIILEKSDEVCAFPECVETGAGPVKVFDPGVPIFWRTITE